METHSLTKKQNKTVRVTVRLSENQFKQISENSEKAGIAIATYLRICGLRQNIKIRITEEQIVIYKQLCSCSNSLNQIAKGVNICGALSLLPEIEKTINDINVIIEKIGK